MSGFARHHRGIGYWVDVPFFGNACYSCRALQDSGRPCEFYTEAEMIDAIDDALDYTLGYREVRRARMIQAGADAAAEEDL
jgi:hypothetical protein